VNKKVVVTGCSGFIGFHLSNSLLDSDHTVIGIDSLNKNNSGTFWHANGEVLPW